VSQSVTIAAKASADVEVDVPAGDRVEAYLDGGDLLAADDVAVAVAARRPELKVLIAGEDSFWKQLYTSIPGIAVDLAAVGSGQAAPDGDGYDMVVYSGVSVPAEPKAAFIAVAPPGGAPGVSASGVVETPALTLLRTNDPLLDDVDLTQLAVAQAQRLQVTSGEVLAGAEGAPLLVRGQANGRRFLYLPFALADSNLPVQVAFPILGDRMLSELAGLALANTAIEVGQSLPVDPASAAELTDPRGQTRTVPAGSPAVIADSAGFWTVEVQERPTRLVAVNHSNRESAIAPRLELKAQTYESQLLAEPAQIEVSLLRWLLLPLLALLAWETWLSWRRLGVGRRQWRLALAARAAIAALLIGALLAPSIPRSSNRVATVFLLDGSDSLGVSGDAAALQWLKDALASRPDDALSAVVVFGGNAQLDKALQASSVFDGPQVTGLLPDTTDIATALRLGAAVLPSDARRRVVVISDGRANAGDALAEAERLGIDDVQVDVHTVDQSVGADAAVSGIDVPRLARVGDEVKVTVNVNATEPGPVTVELRRDGASIGTETIDAVAGSNQVTFTDSAGSDAGAVLRYQAIVTAVGDTRPQNDAAFSAVPVDGPARVLIVEGTQGEAATLNNALRAGGVNTEVVGPTGITDAQALASYTSIVLVNVHADELNGSQIEALTVAVRDLGRGLVTVGGARSYGVGGYRGSPLSELLPVDSEILDPKRRKTVAEVLSIDTSGSMAACHCDDGVNTISDQGGVNKTDISRAAAERTIQALTASDQIGVVAWNSGTEWVIDLQPLPSQAVIDEGLGKLSPGGGTDLRDSLEAAAEKLIESDAELKHIILFTDGFTDVNIIDDVADQAGALYDEYGITVSVLGTGEGAAPSLEDVAEQGRGRYYPGADINDVPQIMAEEAVIASRDFINEGQFLPEVTSTDPVVEPLTASPPLLGYVATTAKPQSSTLLRIGPDRDPLLATWQAGLGRVTSWTSDASATWSQQWADWDGYVDFWTRVTKSTFPAGEVTGAAQATVRNGQLEITVEGTGNFPDGANAVATVAGPDGQRIEVPLDRVGGDRYEGQVAAPRDGTYAVGVNVTDRGETVLSSSTLASESYPAEYEPGAADTAGMLALSQGSGGRGEIAAEAAFDVGTLEAGVRRMQLAGPFLLIAALLFPVAVTLSRLSLRGATLQGARAGLRSGGRRMRAALPRLGTPDPENRPNPAARPDTVRPTVSPPQRPAASDSAEPEKVPATASRPSSSATVNELLERKRSRQG
jgi:Mg-chelatase subunit ChlD